MGLMTQAMVDALVAGKTRVCIMEWTFAGTTYRYSKDGVAIDEYPYPPRVASFGGLGGTLLALLAGRHLVDDTRHVTLQEKNGDITQLIAGENAEQVIGSSVVLKLIAEDVDSSDWYTFYTGDVFDYGRDGPGRWTLSLQPPYADQLKGRIKTPLIAPYDFPNADDTAKNKPVPLLWGEHDSTSTGRTGLLPTLSVDTTKSHYLVALGQLKTTAATFNVWENGVLQTEGVGNDYVLGAVQSGGRYYRVININGAATEPVTCDMEGMTDTGVGGGTTITNPAEQLKLLLANWVFGELGDTSGYGVPSDSPVDEYTFDLVAAFLDRSGVTSSRYIAGDRTGEDIVDEYLTEHNLFAYWTPEGKFALAHCDWFVNDIYDTSFPWFQFGQRGVGRSLDYRYLSDQRYDEIAAKHLYSTNDGDFLEQIRVKDPDAGLDARLDMELYWSRASL
jgi:hypothetical protein